MASADATLDWFSGDSMMWMRSTTRRIAAVWAAMTMLIACGSEEEATSAEAARSTVESETSEHEVPTGVGEEPPDEPALPEGATIPEPENNAAGAAREGGPMVRARWLASFVPGYVQLACREDFFFRACFEETSGSSCATSMRAAIRRCARDNRVGLGSTVGSAEESAGISERLSACAGETYENMLTEAGKRIHSARCDNPSAWAQGR